MGLAAEQSDYPTSRVVVLPVPYDAASSGASVGAREGPLAILSASQEIEHYDLQLDRVPAQVGIHTLPDLIPNLAGPEAMQADIRNVASAVLADDKFLVTIGGDHSITTALVDAHLSRFPRLGVLYLDAHGDLLDRYLGTAHSHASAARRVLERCPLLQIGVRSAGPEEADLVRERRMNRQIFTVEDLRQDRGGLEASIDSFSDEVYVSIDLDVFDPSIMAAVDLPEPGGLQWHEALDVLRGVAARKRIVGFDLVELSPREGPRACAYLAARLVYRLIGYATEPTFGDATSARS